MKVKLVVVEGKPEGLEIPMKGNRFTIGRDPRCNLRPNSELVSKTHCLIQTDDRLVKVSDLGSTNGTFVNGKKIDAKTDVQNGDRIKVGPLVFAVTILQDAPVEVAAASPAAADDDPMQWLLSDREGNVGEPTNDTTVMELPIGLIDPTQESVAASAEETVADKPTGPYKPKVATTGPKRDTAEAASDLLNKLFVRRRPSS